MKLQELNLTYDYLDLDPLFWQRVSPTPLEEPFLISANLSAFVLIGLDHDVVEDEDFLRFLNGELPLGEQSYAMCYAGFVIVESYGYLQNEQGRYYLLFEEVLDHTAHPMAQWQSVGFNHSVINSDNFSIEGITIDYGPFAFLDDYDSGYVCNHTDMGGRYSFGNQPYIGHWNLFKLAQAFSPLGNFDRLKSLLDSYGTR